MSDKTVFVQQRTHSTTAPAITQEVIELERATITPAEQLAEMADSLTTVQRFLLKRRLGKLRMREAEQIAAAMGQAILQSTVHKLSLALDLDKKKVFASYVRASSDLQREIQRLEADFRHALAVELIRIDSTTSEYKNTASNQIAAMQAEGSLTDTEAARFSSRYAEVGEHLLEDNLASYEALRGNFRELLIRTLSLFMAQLEDAKLL